MSVSLWHVLSPGVNRPFEAQGGIFREEAIMLLRRFYVQENERGVCLNFSPFFFLFTKPRGLPPFFQAGGVCGGRMRFEWLANHIHESSSLLHDISSRAETKEKP